LETREAELWYYRLPIEMTRGDPRFANLEKIGVHHYDLLP